MNMFKTVNGRRARIIQGGCIYCERSDTCGNVFEFTEVRDSGLVVKHSIITRCKAVAWARMLAYLQGDTHERH